MSASIRHQAARLATHWWSEPGRPQVAICDRCNGDVPRGSGYLNPMGMFGSPDLYCSDCFDPSVFSTGARTTTDDSTVSRSDVIQSGWTLLLAGIGLGWFVSPWWWLAVPAGLICLFSAPSD